MDSEIANISAYMFSSKITRTGLNKDTPVDWSWDVLEMKGLHDASSFGVSEKCLSIKIFASFHIFMSENRPFPYM